ncbi:MAG: anhydro-N-acetylmuramic acid kinase [Rickettsiales bacterium]|nr:anhydro-N-acetylmuramic acid kinase [Rickettsiales bacterium]
MTSTIQFPAHVIGLMSGTSADGVDAAMLFTDGQTIVEAGESLFVPYDDALRADILALTRGVGDVADVARRLTDVHIEAVEALIAKANVSRETIALIGFHGQTIRHAPAEGITLQIGDGARMARELGIPVVADFRSNDVANGGQGAPLVPLYHAALARDLPKPLMVVNIGGVSNVTWMGHSGEAGAPLPSGEADLLNERSEFRKSGEGGSPLDVTPPSPEFAANHLSGDWANSTSPEGRGSPVATSAPLIAFDCGPGNALIDDWVFRHTGKRYDANGELAAMGVADNVAVAAFLRDPFFLADAPKSLDRNHFEHVVPAMLKNVEARGGAKANSTSAVADGAATLTHMTATAIALSFGAVPEAPKQVLICGGGRHNAHIMGLLRACVNAPVAAVEDVGWNGDMLEAEAFAYLAARSVLSLPLSLPTTTGVHQPVTGGVFYPAGCVGGS